MTTKQKAFRKKLLARIHTAPKYRVLYQDDETAWREKLMAHFGASSAANLTIEQLVALDNWLRQDLPELPVIKNSRARRHDATKRQIEAIRKLWALYARDKSESALRAFVKRVTKNTYIHLNGMTRADATKVILALKNSLGALK